MWKQYKIRRRKKVNQLRHWVSLAKMLFRCYMSVRSVLTVVSMSVCQYWMLSVLTVVPMSVCVSTECWLFWQWSPWVCVTAECWLFWQWPHCATCTRMWWHCTMCSVEFTPSTSSVFTACLPTHRLVMVHVQSLVPLIGVADRSESEHCVADHSESVHCVADHSGRVHCIADHWSCALCCWLL